MDSNSILDRGDRGFFLNRILSRETSIGQSSRIYYRDGDQGVPFKWEKQPGTPMNPPKKEVIPPPTPPPAVQSLGLRKPCVDQVKESKLLRSRVWFWKKRKQKDKSQRGGYNSNSAKVSYVNSERFDSGSSNGDFIGSPVERYRSYSSSSSSCSSNGRHLQPSRFRKESQRLPFYCNSWSLSDIFERIQRRA